jgi:hypothetical protein
MRKYQDIKREYTDHFQIEMFCDICGAKSPSAHSWGQDYNTIETEIIYRHGNTWPGDGFSGTEIEYDICPKCFKTKLMVWLKEQGAAPTESEHSG